MRESDFINAMQRILQPLKARVLLMVGRAIIAAVKDSTSIQEAQLSALKGESLDGVQRIQEFGFTSNPPPGSEAIIVALGGNRENVVIIATDNREVRIKNLASGETAIYTNDGTYIHLKKAGQVEVKAATKLTVDVPDSEFTGNIKVLGKAEVVGTSKLTGAVTAEATIAATGNISSQANILAAGTIGAAAFAGPGGSGPVTSTENISTTANVIGGGTDLATVKSTFNTHTHPENGTGGGTTSAPNETL
jgi:phage baseplate assembly protein V